jgi:hypothetical protein
MGTKKKVEGSLPVDDNPVDKVEICENCGYVYRVCLFKEGDDYNDFGQRYCPFCGRLTSIW